MGKYVDAFENRGPGGALPGNLGDFERARTEFGAAVTLSSGYPSKQNARGTTESGVVRALLVKQIVRQE